MLINRLVICQHHPGRNVLNLISCSVNFCLSAPNGNKVDFEQFEQHRRRGSLIVDVREPKELTNDGIVPGAVNIPLGMVEEAFKMDGTQFKGIFAFKKPLQHHPVVFLCLKGIRAKKAKDYVDSVHGYSNTYYYPGSFAEWSEKIQSSK